MKKPGWKEYFRFSRKERYGAFGLSLLVGLIILSPKIFKNSKLSGSELAYLQNKLAENKRKDSTEILTDREDGFQKREAKAKTVARLFYFDPNEIILQDWLELGIRESTARIIENFKAKGGKFRKAEDLKKIYGLREEEFQRIYPFIRIPERRKNSDWNAPQTVVFSDKNDRKAFTPVQNENTGDFKNRSGTVNYSNSFSTNYSKRKAAKIEINAADSADFDQLPGIGPTLSRRILNFRNSLGGFISTGQIREVYGITDSLYEKLLPYLSCTTDQLKPIDINSAEYILLKDHPYIRAGLARQLVNYRKQHGPFSSPAALLALEGTDQQWLEKISPYLKF